MYILDPLYYIYKKEYRKTLIAISKKISDRYNVSVLRVIGDMVWCAVRYGAMWTEYDDLDFFVRSKRNRETYITTFFNFRLYNKLNNKDYRNVFHEKTIFLEKFKKYIKRFWIDINRCSYAEIKDFLSSHNTVVAKASHGDSGKEVQVIENLREKNLDSIISYLKKNNLNLIEEQIVNCDEVRALNNSSLNTLRIVTVKKNDNIELLFAGIRIGGKNAKIDNISQGGRVARINISTGKIDSLFYSKKSSNGSYETGADELNAIGFQIPHYDKVIDIVKNAAMLVPEIRIVAWDVAITPTDIELVEGNESFGSVIMQLFYNSRETGLKPRLMEFIK